MRTTAVFDPTGAVFLGVFTTVFTTAFLGFFTVFYFRWGEHFATVTADVVTALLASEHFPSDSWVKTFGFVGRHILCIGTCAASRLSPPILSGRARGLVPSTTRTCRW